MTMSAGSKAPLVMQTMGQLGLAILKPVVSAALGAAAGLVVGWTALCVWAISVGSTELTAFDAAVWERFIVAMMGLGAVAGLLVGWVRMTRTSRYIDDRPRPARIRSEVARAIVASQLGASVIRLSVDPFEGGTVHYAREVRYDQHGSMNTAVLLKSLHSDLAVLMTGVDQLEFAASRPWIKPLLSSIEDRITEIQVRAALAGEIGEPYLDRAELLKMAVQLADSALENAPRGFADRLEQELANKVTLKGDRFYAIRNEFILRAERAAHSATQPESSGSVVA